MLVGEGRRLVTLTGPGGTGKTRLAIALAGRCEGSFADGVYFVPLMAVTEEADLWPALADATESPPTGQAPHGHLRLLGRA